jgi:hypothetical protein
VKKTKKKSKTVKKQKHVPKTAKAKPEETMDRKALKAVVSQLKDMGTDIKVFKSDTDEALQKKINEALQKLPPPNVMKKLESIVPEKLVTILKRDCIGLFIDLSDVSCVRCKDSQTCITTFLKNVKDGARDLDKAMPDPEPEKVEAKVKITPVTKYKPGRLVFVRDVKNPNPKGDDYHNTLQNVLDNQPETLQELRAIVEEDFDIDSDGQFMKFVTSMRDPKEGIIKLDVDLSEKNKTELRNAGYDL